MGKFPVILVSLKGMNAGTYEKALEMSVEIIRSEARRFQYLLDSERLRGNFVQQSEGSV